MKARKFQIRLVETKKYLIHKANKNICICVDRKKTFLCYQNDIKNGFMPYSNSDVSQPLIKEGWTIIPEQHLIHFGFLPKKS